MCVCVCPYIFFSRFFSIIGYYKILKRFFECFTNTHCGVSEEAKLRNCIIGGLCNKWEIFFFNPLSPQSPVKTLACITDFSLAEPLLKLLISSGIHHLQCQNHDNCTCWNRHSTHWPGNIRGTVIKSSHMQVVCPVEGSIPRADFSGTWGLTLKYFSQPHMWLWVHDPTFFFFGHTVWLVRS